MKRANQLSQQYKQKPGSRNGRPNKFNKGGVQFVQTSQEGNPNEAPVPGKNGRCFQDKECWACKKMGHTAYFCPTIPYTGMCNYVCKFNFSNQLVEHINKWWILLDTCSTCNVTNNHELLKNIHQCSQNDIIQVLTNGGGMIF